MLKHPLYAHVRACRGSEARFFTPLTHSANRLPRSKHANIFARARSEPYHTHSTWSIYVSTVHMSHWGPSRTLLTAFDTRVHRRVRIKLDLHILLSADVCHPATNIE